MDTYLALQHRTDTVYLRPLRTIRTLAAASSHAITRSQRTAGAGAPEPCVLVASAPQSLGPAAVPDVTVLRRHHITGAHDVTT